MITLCLNADSDVDMYQLPYGKGNQQRHYRKIKLLLKSINSRMGRGKTIIMKITHSLRNKYQSPYGKGKKQDFKNDCETLAVSIPVWER